jgi:hypothetical protein
MINKRFMVASVFFAVGMLGVVSVASAATLVSAKITGPKTITVVYSQAVSTAIGDYANFTGALSSNSVSSVSGSGTNTVTLNLSGPSLPASANGYFVLGANVKDVADNNYVPSGAYAATDGQSPAIASLSISSNNTDNTFAGVGDTVSITFTTNETVQSPVVTIAGHSFSIGGTGTGPYSENYTLQSSDAAQVVPVTIALMDTVNNQNNITFSIANSTSTNANVSIASLTSNANTQGTLKIGNSIVFTLMPAVAEPNARIVGSYNGQALSWSSTNGGLSYTATYTIASGQSDQNVPLQITGVVLYDQSGNASAPASGTDVQKTIDANGSIIAETVPVPSETANVTPSYTFTSSKAGTISYGGDCTSTATTAVAGSNTIVFGTLANGVHNNCTITVTSQDGNASNLLAVSSFTETGGAAALSSSSSTSTISGASTSSIMAYKFSSFLGVGSSGTSVTALQKRLTLAGFYSGSITGYYGAQTAVAVKAYQKAHGIDQLGYVGPSTRTALNIGE